MRFPPWLVVLRTAVLVALTASAALLADYVADAPSFCSAVSGCGAIRRSELSHLRLGEGQLVPLPALGVAAFSVLFAASMLASRRVTLILAALGGAVGLWLLGVQAFQLRVFCWLCVTTDVSALLAALASAMSARQPTDARQAALLPSAWWGLATLALSAPLLWPLVKASPAVPAAVLRYYQPGKLNVVEFVDFQCPSCRRFHGTLKAALASYGERVHFVRLNKPLLSHPNARDAARAFICAGAEGAERGEAMADALFKARDLSQTAIEGLARDVGLDPSRFEACVLDPATDARIDREAELLKPPDLEGLPTTYIGGKRLVGAHDEAAVRDTIEKAERGDGVSGVPWPAYLVVTLGLAAALIVRGRKNR